VGTWSCDTLGAIKFKDLGGGRCRGDFLFAKLTPFLPELEMTMFSLSQTKEVVVSDPDFENKIRDSFTHQGVMQALNGKLVTVKPGFVEMHLPFSTSVAQQHGFFHGGLVATVADSASGYAAYTVLDKGEECLSAEFKVNFLSPARGDKLIARGRVLKAGRTLVITEATVTVVRDGEEIDCAIMLHTLMRAKHVKSGKGLVDSTT
jgi:uncharacterized protein (TIGR00369 family)